MLGACTGALRHVFSQNRNMTVYITFSYSSVQLQTYFKRKALFVKLVFLFILQVINAEICDFIVM